MGPRVMAGEAVVSLRRAIAVLEGRAVERLTVPEQPLPRAARAGAAPLEGEPRSRDPASGASAVASMSAPSEASRSAPSVASLAPLRTDILPFEVPALDRLFAAGGLLIGGLHEARAEESRDGVAALGFSLAIAARLLATRAGACVFVTEPRAALEGAGLFGPGLHQFGLDPARVVIVRAARARDALTVMEDALGCRGVAATIGAVHGQPDALDLTASRRLALRAREAGRTALLWRPGAPAEPTAALTRFAVRAAPSATLNGYAAGVGRAAFTVDVEKNRDGRVGHATLAWDHHDRRFTPHAAPVGTRSAAPFDRSAAPLGDRGAIVAWPGAERPVLRGGAR